MNVFDLHLPLADLCDIAATIDAMKLISTGFMDITTFSFIP